MTPQQISKALIDEDPDVRHAAVDVYYQRNKL
jgi:hypothetical protein